MNRNIKLIKDINDNSNIEDIRGYTAYIYFNITSNDSTTLKYLIDNSPEFDFNIFEFVSGLKLLI